ncbi:hypothetical protein KOW79_021520 [Hemibagrus wyckioides]|uniref:Ig-like domain-containing protein n=1 Tax=Hemibagrus wyckioides TaxID=337641 RepID=A0A9D3N448_9TELE|nr:hypothetical protein KOW79_021520 [Hemibagrus wyckioides]
MRILQLHFYLLVCCGAAECFTEKSVSLGQNVTLKCEVSVRDVFWFLMKPSEAPVYILRSFSDKSLSADYRNTTFSKRFSLQYNSSLFIHNISTNELGVYYCIQTQKASPPDISSGIRLYIQNHSAENQTCNTERPQNHTESDRTEDISLWTSLIISVIINCALVITGVTVLTVYCCRRSPKTRTQPPGLQQSQGNNDLVYADVQVLTTDRATRTSNLNSTYALLKPVTRSDPRHTT